MSYLALAKKAEDDLRTKGRVLEVQEADTIQAVKICSLVLQDEIWLILDHSFIPHDGLACYYAEEIPLLRDRTPEEIQEIHKVKLAFPGCRVIQEGPDSAPAEEPQRGGLNLKAG